MRSFYLNTVLGATVLTDPLIASTTILSVKREGFGFKQVASSPGSRDFIYSATGSITFVNAFNPGEKIFVLCL